MLFRSRSATSRNKSRTPGGPPRSSKATPTTRARRRSNCTTCSSNRRTTRPKWPSNNRHGTPTHNSSLHTPQSRIRHQPPTLNPTPTLPTLLTHNNNLLRHLISNAPPPVTAAASPANTRRNIPSTRNLRRSASRTIRTRDSTIRPRQTRMASQLSSFFMKRHGTRRGMSTGGTARTAMGSARRCGGWTLQST